MKPLKITATDLRRTLVPGFKLRLVLSPQGKCNKVRVVNSVDNKGAHLTGEDIISTSLLPWPLARDLKATKKGFEILHDGKKQLRYEWVSEGA
jgi:hypothetical protein